MVYKASPVTPNTMSERLMSTSLVRIVSDLTPTSKAHEMTMSKPATVNKKLSTIVTLPKM
jgi:hypothetical protein